MSTLRRILVLTALTPAVIIGAGLPASATFAASTAPVSTTIGTATVAPATGVSLDDTCWWGIKWSTTVTWTASPTARVTGYTVTAHKSNGTTETVSQTAGTRASHSLPSNVVSYSVTTRTDYGWTAVSPEIAAVPC